MNKDVSWALRESGRRNVALNKESITLARRPIDSEHASARWIGRDALKELTSPEVVRRLS